MEKKGLESLRLAEAARMNTQLRVVMFDGTQAHELANYVGQRNSVVWYTADGAWDMDENLRKKLKAVGFRPPETSEQCDRTKCRQMIRRIYGMPGEAPAAQTDQDKEDWGEDWVEEDEQGADEVPVTIKKGQQSQQVNGERSQAPTAAALAAAPANEQKQMIGEALHAAVSRYEPERAGEITGALLEMDNGDLLRLLETESELENKVVIAMHLLSSPNPTGKPTIFGPDAMANSSKDQKDPWVESDPWTRKTEETSRKNRQMSLGK
jgi:hypothetical protein